MMDKNLALRAELVDGLEYRIRRERSILQRRLACEQPAEELPPVRLHSRRTGRLYQVFQALGEDDA